MNYLLVVWVLIFTPRRSILLLSSCFFPRRTNLLSPTSGRVININFPGESACQEDSGHHHRPVQQDQIRRKAEYGSLPSAPAPHTSPQLARCRAQPPHGHTNPFYRRGICSVGYLLLYTAPQFSILYFFPSCCRKVR